MNKKDLTDRIFTKGTYLCVGLDTDRSRIPAHLLSASGDPVFAFNKAIIDATKDLCVAYKINTAFYESMGLRGWESLQRTVEYIPDSHFRIADAKRGDIGNTSHQYAKAFFETYDFDAVTVAPYMGRDSVEPFLQYPGKWAVLLGLTSNEGSGDLQLQRTADERFYYELVFEKAMEWGREENLMFVVGATRDDQLDHIRKLAPNHFFLVPGVGAQGGNLGGVSRYGLNQDGGLLVNVSRAVIYAGSGEDFAEASRQVAGKYQQEMKEYLKNIDRSH
jgi:orotidine-5'-phosphate decarboxylase